MTKSLLFVVTLFLSFAVSASSGFAQISADENGKLVLDQKVLTLQCPPGARGRGEASKSLVVKAKTQLKVKTGKEEYKYSVEYGKLVVNGSKAEWDLAGEHPGTYRLSVAIVKDGQILGHYDDYLKVLDGECIIDCECPTLGVMPSLETVKNGETLTFIASLSGGASVSYAWTVKNGEIIEGQGTAEIKVRAKRNATLDTVTATVSISGLDPDCHCMTEASASATIIL